MLDAIKNRRSVRQYEDKEISKEMLEELIKAASLAPSPFNLQPWKFYIIEDRKKKLEIRKIYDKATEKIKFFKKIHLTNVPIYNQDATFLEKATLIIPCYNKKTPYARDALAMAVQNLMLEATANELGSVCIGRPTTFNKYKKQIKDLIGIEKNYEIPYIVALGYSVKSLKEYYVPKRKSIEEVMKII